ncbi:MAG: hypothetical protein OEV40_15620 [Acidimicrobiia bacterium]|nr:hypothetical protein [Acidimicrobiia bacterium]
MFPTRFAARIAAATLAAALAVGGLLGVGAVGVSHHDGDTAGDETAATWSFTSPGDGKGWSGTNGATWS